MQLFKLLSESSAYTIIGGGDTTTALELFGKPEQIDFISTGGGALLAYLASSNPAQEYESIKLIASNQ